MKKSLLVLAGLALLAAPSLHAQGRGRSAGFAGRGAGSAGFARASAFDHNSALYRNRYHGRGGYGRGRYYYLGGVPYFYPFFDYGFGYPYYGYGGGFGYGYGYATPYDGGYYGDPGPGYYGGPAYEGQVIQQTANGNGRAGAPSLPSAVQRQLAKRGYYKGTIDGQFGESSRGALRRFQRDNHLKETGRIDEPTLQALGFSDRR